MDKGKGEEAKPPSEAKDAAKAKDAAVKAKEAEAKSKEADPKAKDAPTSQPSKKEDPSPPDKTQGKCRSHQIFAVTKFGFHLATYIMCAQM